MGYIDSSAYPLSPRKGNREKKAGERKKNGVKDGKKRMKEKKLSEKDRKREGNSWKGWKLRGKEWTEEGRINESS